MGKEHREPGKMTRGEILTLTLTSMVIATVAAYTFYWLALTPPNPEYTLILDAIEWAEHSIKLYEKYYPNPPPEEEWFTLIVPPNVWVELVAVYGGSQFYKGEEVGSHYLTIPELPGVAGLIAPGANFRIGVFKLAPGEQVQLQCGEYCAPFHDYMSYARIVAKEPRIIELHLWMHQFYFDIHDPDEPHKLDPTVPWEQGGPQDKYRGEDLVLIKAELGDILRITLHVTNEHEPEFEIMSLASLGLGFEVEARVGEPVTFEIRLDKIGEFDLYCGIPCGSGHELMKAKLVVLPPGSLGA